MNQTETIKLHITPVLKQQLSDIATNHNVKVSFVIKTILNDYITYYYAAKKNQILDE